MNPQTGRLSDAVWRALIELEDEQMAELRRLDWQNQEKTADKSDAAREWWRTCRDILQGLLDDQTEYNPRFPADAIERLRRICDDQSRGHVPDVVEDSRKLGSGLWRGEAEDRQCAVRYVQAAKAGLIADKSPVKTVADSFLVTRQTVQSWVVQSSAFEEDDPAQLSANEIFDRMKKAASRSRQNGRGAQAILNRSRRQPER